MASAELKHNRKRSLGIVYELLVRRLAECLVRHDKDGFQGTRDVIREHFSSGPIARELELFNALRSVRGVSDSSARKLITEVLVAAKKIDAAELDRRRGLLVRDINVTFGRDFYGRYRLEEYRLLASIQMLLDSARRSLVTESPLRVRLEDALATYMVLPVGVQSDDFGGQPVDQVVYSMALKRFDEKYSHELSKRQKVLLGRYVRAAVTGDSEKLTEHMAGEKLAIHESLRAASKLDEVKGDKVMLERMGEALDKLAGVDAGGGEDAVGELMLFIRLCEEVESRE